jgi:hypothetical protein
VKTKAAGKAAEKTVEFDPEAPGWDHHRIFAPRATAVWMALLVIASFPDVFLGYSSFVLRDFKDFGYPLAAFHRESFWAGEIPHWNPYSYCGVPFLAQWNTLVLYPGSLVYLLLPLPWSLNLFCLLHVYIGGVGMYLLVRRWTGNNFSGCVAAVAFMFCGLSQNCLMWPNNIAALALLPWVWNAVERGCLQGGRWLLLGVIAGSLQMLTGAPEIILVTWAGAVIIVASHFRSETRVPAKSLFGRLGITILWITGLAAVQLLPFLDLLARSQRVGGEQVIDWPADPLFWTNMFMPLAGATRYDCGTVFLKGQDWIHSYYSGIATLFLAGVGVLGLKDRRLRFLSVGTGLACLLALGPAGHLYAWIEGIVPLSIMRYPVKFLIVPAVVLPILAGAGIRPLMQLAFRARSIHVALGVTCLLFAASYIGVGTATSQGEITSGTIGNALTRLAWFVVALVCLYLGVRSGPVRRAPWLQLAFVLVVWWDLKTHLPSMTPAVPSPLFTTENSTLAAMNPRPRIGFGRTYVPKVTRELIHFYNGAPFEEKLIRSRVVSVGNLNLAEEVPCFDGFFSLWSPEFAAIRTILSSGPGGLSPTMADFLSISHVASSRQFGEWIPRPSANAWVTVGQEPVPLSPAEISNRLRYGRFDSRREVFLAEPIAESIAEPAPSADPSASIESGEFGAQEISFTLSATKKTMAVIAQLHHPGWQAEVDGKAVPLLNANQGFQALAVPAGQHHVRLRFVDRKFQVGGILSLISLMGLFLCWWWWRPDRPVEADSA